MKNLDEISKQFAIRLQELPKGDFGVDHDEVNNHVMKTPVVTTKETKDLRETIREKYVLTADRQKYIFTEYSIEMKHFRDIGVFDNNFHLYILQQLSKIFIFQSIKSDDSTITKIGNIYNQVTDKVMGHGVIKDFLSDYVFDPIEVTPAQFVTLVQLIISTLPDDARPLNNKAPKTITLKER